MVDQKGQSQWRLRDRLAKNSPHFSCQECGTVYPKWAGKCDSCGGWNCIIEDLPIETATKGLTLNKARKIDFVGLEGTSPPPSRRLTLISELDRVCGGGLVPGSALLVGGDPGIGKSTLLLQAVASLAPHHHCVYISGEEAVDQVRLRAMRLGLSSSPVHLASATNLRDILTSIDQVKPPDVVVIDSIQTIYLDLLDSAPGTVSQVRACASELIRVAKKRGFTLFLVGHVTKDGQIAGPRVLEHMVDTVLYFEGDRGHAFRILRAVKNRFGATDEIGVFEMGDNGLSGVANPSALFLAERRGNVSGSCVFAGIEGSRPMLVEIQALVAPTSTGTPRRAVVGWDSARLAMILAVLDTRCGLSLSANDVYLNVAGGLRVQEPAADLAVAAALLSSVSQIPVDSGMVVFGEIGLSGEIRAVGQTESRLKEATKLGFGKAMIPASQRGKSNVKNRSLIDGGLTINMVGHVQSLVSLFQDKTPKKEEKQ